MTSNVGGFAAVVLAAGQGTRMKSALPKVLHEIAGRPMVDWPVAAALEAGAARVVVVLGYGKAQVEAALELAGGRVETALQAEQRGTGHAVRCALPSLEGFEGTVVILYGDVPLLEASALEALVGARGAAALSLLTCRTSSPTGYGRILRDGTGAVVGIREEKDCSDAERAIDEINPGVYATDAAFLREALAALTDDNAQGELYLTDIVAAAAARGGARAVPWALESLSGVNDRAQLADAAAVMRRRIATRHARAGVTIRDLARVDIDAEVTIEADAVIEPGVVLRGATAIGAGAHVDVGCVVTDSVLEPGAYLEPYSVVTESRVGPAAHVGPFSHLRPGSVMGPRAKVGNFVEMKKTTLGEDAKANHLSYLGDGTVGPRVNIGAGTIFCNYDGFRKHQTVLEEGCFIGSDSQLVAPVRVGAGAYVATGTTVTKDVPPDALAVGRIRQSNKEGYASRLKARFAALAKAEKEKKDAQEP